MFNYIKTAETATRLLTKFGRSGTLTTVTEGAYDFDSGTVANTEVETTVKCCDFPYKSNEYDNNLIQKDDRYALINSAASNIDVSDKLTLDGVVWNIVKVERIAPSGVLVMWKVQIRRG